MRKSLNMFFNNLKSSIYKQALLKKLTFIFGSNPDSTMKSLILLKEFELFITGITGISKSKNFVLSFASSKSPLTK